MKRKIGIVALALMPGAVFVGLVACDNRATDNTAYTITVKAADNGKVAANAKSATAGTEITFTVTANTGYKVSEVKMNGAALTVTDGKAAFKMSAANVEITATFVLEEQPAPGQHKVTVSTVKCGEVSADKAVAVKDEVVTLTVKAAFGYTLTDVKLNGEVLVAKDGGYSFAMPDSDVTVTATFATAANVSTDAAPQNTTARLTSRAMAGSLATADVVLAYTDNGLSLTAYVTDSVVTSADGVGLYIGRNTYAGGSIGKDNIGVELLVSGSKVYKVTNGAYAADAETAIDGATIVAWVVDGEVVGYKATLEVPYTTLGTNKETAENNLTVLPVLSNNDRTMANVATYGNGEIGNADTYYLLKNGKLSDNYYLYGAGMLGEEVAEVASQIREYEKVADLILKGDSYRLCSPFDGNYSVQMIVGKDKKQAYVCGVRIHGVPCDYDNFVALTGLSEGLTYRIEELDITASGKALTTIGVRLPRLPDFGAWTWHVFAVD